MKYVASLLVCGLAVLTSGWSSQELPPVQSPTFRTGIAAVQLDVSVLDRQRRPVRGLTAADFTVLEEGRPRRLVAFSAVELPAPPVDPASPADVGPPDVTRNDLPEGRLVVILLDPFLERVMVNGRVTIADPPGITALRATARRVVDGLGPGDLAAVGHTIYGIPHNFTTDRNRLKRAIDSSAFGTNKRADGEEWGNCQCGMCRLEAITRVATSLRDETQRRKTIFFIGERVRLAPVAGPCQAYLEPATKAMVHATQLASVTVHTVDPNSLETTNVHAGDDFMPDRPISEAAAEQERANRAQLIERQQSLQTVADWTGGRAILNTNRPEETVRPILDESSAYYLLAFETPDVKPDGRFHEVTVRVNRPDVQVRTRKGYYAEPVTDRGLKGGTPVSLEALSRRLLPERGMPMSVAATAFRGPDGTPVVIVTTGVRAGPANRSTEPAANLGAPQFEPIEILSSAFRDGVQDVDWQRQRLSVAMPAAAPGELRYESVSTLALKPGTYEVRVASRHERSDLVGSVHTFVDVPDFDDGLITVSGPVLFDKRARIATPAEALAGILDAAPTTRREFTTADEVSALIRVYQRRQHSPVPVAIVFRVLDGTREEASVEIPLAADQFAGGSADGLYRLPLDLLRPGSYVLRVEASANRETARRDVPFTLR
jgi:VWFA-related protein